MISERRYYANRPEKTVENVSSIGNFRVAYYRDMFFIYAYYMGNYYEADVRDTKVENSIIIPAIVAQCNDPYKFKKIPEEI